MTTRDVTIAELMKTREELHRDLVNAPAFKANTEWFKDRVNEMAYLNRTLERLGAIPAV